MDPNVLLARYSKLLSVSNPIDISDHSCNLIGFYLCWFRKYLTSSALCAHLFIVLLETAGIIYKKRQSFLLLCEDHVNVEYA